MYDGVIVTYWRHGIHLVWSVLARSQMIRCSVCQDKKKNRVITKCFHMFCDGCLEKSIKVSMRMRKGTIILL